MGRPNTTFRRLREDEWKMSRTEAAEHLVAAGLEVGITVYLVARTIANWEDGQTGWPQARYRRLLHAVTGRTAKELGFTPPPPRVNRAAEPESNDPQKAGEDDMHRRDLLRGAGALALSALTPAAGSRPALGQPHLHALTAAEQELYEQDRDHGSADLGRQAATALHTAHTWLDEGRYGEELGRQLHTATGMLSVAAGWLALDARRTADARSLYTEALASARQADDPGLEAHAFACLSLLAHATGRPREAVTNARVAQRAAAELGSPRWLSLLSMREARGWALQHDSARTEKALVRAYTLYSQGPSDADPAWLDFYCTGELAGLESLCRADLGQHQRAVAGAEQAVMLFTDGHPRNRALYTADIALHHARSPRPDLDAVTDAGRRTLAYLPDVRSQRLVRSLNGIADALHTHRTVPCVAEYLDTHHAAHLPPAA
ncbi:hypothetical protein ABT095_14440 [Kitasatospora sp. NPDC002227]|uniref:hypothetical protein n=1 Tax=Kitasatospora sp. NPDC002227 TaxID=3154773 RepID=UPI00332E2A1D